MWSQWFASGIFAISMAIGMGACVVNVDESTDENEIAQPVSDAELREEFTHPRLRWRWPRPLDRRWLRCLPDPYKSYVARDTELCSRIRFYCPEGGVPFFDDCGCGCTVRPEHTVE